MYLSDFMAITDIMSSRAWWSILRNNPASCISLYSPTAKRTRYHTYL